MNKWTWLVLLAIALLGGGFYLSSYQKSKEGAPGLPVPGVPLNAEEFEGGEEGGDLDKDGSGFEPSDGPGGAGMNGDNGTGGADDGDPGLSRDDGAAADMEPIDDQDDPSLKDPGATPPDTVPVVPVKPKK